MVKVYVHTTGLHLDCHEQFKARIASRVHVRQESNPNDCNLILAFCTITSRVGTDVEAAVNEIPGNQPVILVVFHHTFDVDYVVPDSRRFIGRQNVLLVNILFHETHQGLLRCLQNDEELKTVSDYLIRQGAEAPSAPAPASPSNNGDRRRWIGGFICLVVLIVVVVILVLVIEYQQGNLGSWSNSSSGSIAGPNDSIKDPNDSITDPNML